MHELVFKHIDFAEQQTTTKAPPASVDSVGTIVLTVTKGTVSPTCLAMPERFGPDPELRPVDKRIIKKGITERAG